MSEIEISDLSKSFEDVKALENIDLKIESGEIVGVLGPNGAGKSTLTKILTGQIEADSGSVEVLGIDPAENPVRIREKVGILPEREDPPSFLTGEEYLEYVSDIRQTEIDGEEWIEKMNLEGKMQKLTRDLSKGERQKLMMIQAFFHEPEIAFIDEPLVNLDPVIQERSKELFREVRERDGTVVLSTHVISLAEEVCDRVFFLRDGEVVEEITEVENLKQKFLEQE